MHACSLGTATRLGRTRNVKCSQLLPLLMNVSSSGTGLTANHYNSSSVPIRAVTDASSFEVEFRCKGECCMIVIASGDSHNHNDRPFNRD